MPLVPVVTSTEGANITYDFRSQVLTMGGFTELWLTWQANCSGVHQGWFPARWLAPGDEANLLNVSLAGEYSVSAVPLPPDSDCIVAAERVTFDPTVPEWRLTVLTPLLEILTPSLETVGTPIGHPLASGIQSLGIPVDITLGAVGMAWMFGVFLVTGYFKMDTDTIITAAAFVLGFNIAMQFWPAILFVLLNFMIGFLIVRQFGGD